MTLEEFKKIYFMEWFHRVWGRFIGVSFVLPAIYFVARRRVSLPMAYNLAGISLLIGFQGLIGWWMVKSGLKDDLFKPGSHPRVSQYRLTTHLATAFVCYSWMLLGALRIFKNAAMVKNPGQGLDLIMKLRNPRLRGFKIAVTALTALIFTTGLSGGLVAGLDAGLIYNEFPMMGVGLTPPQVRAPRQILLPQERPLRPLVAEYAREPVDSPTQPPHSRNDDLLRCYRTLCFRPPTKCLECVDKGCKEGRDRSAPLDAHTGCSGHLYANLHCSYSIRSSAPGGKPGYFDRRLSARTQVESTTSKDHRHAK